jgi:uncharacterized protein
MPAVCPICQKPAATRPDNPSAPFCSPRCRQLDLGRWLGEEYRVPERHPDGEPAPVPPGSQDDGEEPR